jgi:hypothetical protein
MSSNEHSQLDPEKAEFDSRGVWVTVHVPLILTHAIADIVRSDRFPFKTMKDVVRWSLYRGTRELGAMERCAGIQPFLGLGVFLLRMDTDIRKLEGLFAEFDWLINRQLLPSQRRRARIVAKLVYQLFLNMPPSRDRSWILSESQQRWSDLVRFSSIKQRRRKVVSINER